MESANQLGQRSAPISCPTSMLAARDPTTSTLTDWWTGQFTVLTTSDILSEPAFSTPLEAALVDGQTLYTVMRIYEPVQNVSQQDVCLSITTVDTTPPVDGSIQCHVSSEGAEATAAGCEFGAL